MSPPLTARTLTEVGNDIRARVRSAREEVETCLAAIESHDRTINAFVTVAADAARRQAESADREIAGNRYLGPLHGVPISIKDIIDVTGMPTTAASRVRPADPARGDATVVARLRAAGAIILGKCNLHEFAFGTTGEDSAFGPTVNPHDTRRSPGGSSGGSAAAVACGMGYASVGTDTGGSIRIPAAACGVVGLKPTHGEFPTDGVVPLSRTLDHVGPLARTVHDAWLMYRAMLGAAVKAADSLPPAAPGRLGAPGGYFRARLDADVRASFEAALERLQAAGWTVDEVAIDHAATIAPAYLHVVLAEAAAYHARTLDECPHLYSPAVRLRLELGRCVLGEDYVRAREVSQALRAEVTAALTGRQALVLPSLAIPAPPLGVDAVEVAGETESVRSLTLRLTQPFNLTSHPAISLPCGWTGGGLPCGLQLVGPMGATETLLQTSVAIEAALDVERRVPALIVPAP